MADFKVVYQYRAQHGAVATIDLLTTAKSTEGLRRAICKSIETNSAICVTEPDGWIRIVPVANLIDVLVTTA